MATTKRLTGPEKAAREKKPHATSHKRTAKAEQDRGAALAMYDYFCACKSVKNPIVYTATVLKIARKTLADWVNGRGKPTPEREEARAVVKLQIADRVEEVMREVLAYAPRAAQIAAEAGKVQQIVISGAILQDKRADLLGLPVRRYSADQVGGGARVETPAGAIADPPAVSPAEQYEPIISKIISDGLTEGKTITREQAMEAIAKLKPEAARILKFAPAVETKTG